ncbi:uncharacterized protein DS421_14g462320 [Arachis hypogaea]|nr:uncharacterized protein DS421_14g462320 [Arachis hypogaea]
MVPGEEVAGPLRNWRRSGWTVAELEKGWLDRRVTGAVEGGTQQNWNRGGWSAAELEQRRAGARWTRTDAAEQRLLHGETTRDELLWDSGFEHMRCDATAEMSGDDTKAVGRRLDQIRWRR